MRAAGGSVSIVVPRLVVLTLAALGALVGCDHQAVGGASAAASVVVSSSVTSAASSPAPSAAPPAPKIGPVTIVPPIPAHGMDMMDHCKRLGWSADGRYLGCTSATAGEGDSVAYIARGPATPGAASSDDASVSAPSPKDVVRAGLANGAGAWPFADDLDVVWQVIAGTETRAAVLKVGARVRGEAPSYPIALTGPEPYYLEIHPEYLGVSPDGKTFGVMGHAFAGEWANTFPVALLPIEELASHAFNDAGFARHQKGEFERARALFAAAVRWNAKARLPHYNLACAEARLGHGAEAKKELEAAVALDEAATKKSARSDADLERLRGEPWFDALVR